MQEKSAARSKTFGHDVGVIGGAGHVGLPLAIVLAESGLKTVIYDLNSQALEAIRAGSMPFMEEDGEEHLRRALESGRLEVHGAPDALGDCRFLVLVVGTPLDEHLNPTYAAIHRALDSVLSYLKDGQTLILRSTVYPGISKNVQQYLLSRGKDIRVSFCPERVAQGHSLREIHELPQIVSAFDPETLSSVKELFSRFNPECIELSPMEAEMAKLMTNAWRYIQFAAANQFFMAATSKGMDFDRILHACRFKYPRMASMPGPGFAAGPCLMKDTMQLAAFSHNHFILGHSAMLINEGLPEYLVEMAGNGRDLSGLTAGILGMAFKAESDDARDSLSYKLKKILSLRCARVLCTDPFVKDPGLAPLESVIAESDVLFVGAPHAAYSGLDVPPEKIVVDVWNCLKNTQEGKA